MMRYTFTDQQGRDLRIRKEPGDGAEVIGYIKSGDAFEAEQHGEWLSVGGGYVMGALCEPVAEDSSESALHSMSAAELRDLAEASGIKVKARATKAELIEAIENA